MGGAPGRVGPRAQAASGGGAGMHSGHLPCNLSRFNFFDGVACRVRSPSP